MHEPSCGGTDGELSIPRGGTVSPEDTPGPAGPNPSMSEPAGRPLSVAAPMAKSDIVSGLPTGTEAAR
jgi:hypothetical protein